jgi:hypothetical protein
VDRNGLKLYHAEDGGQLTVTIIYNIFEVEHHLLLQKYSLCNAPINVMPQGGGRPGVPSGFARNFLPQVGIFTILQSPRVGTFDKS